MATSADLTFRISAELTEVKAALSDLKRQFANAGSGAGFKAVSDELGRIPKAARDAEAATKRAAAEQERAAQQAARAQERAAADVAKAREKADRDAAKRAEKIRADDTKAKERAAAEERRKLSQAAPQVTDIVVGLASGQSPFMVAIQQGGQLRDLYGGLVPAARAVGGAILSMVSPLALAGAGVLALTAAWAKGQEEGARFRRLVIETGNSSGQTAYQLTEMARSMDEAWGVTQASAAEALATTVAAARFSGAQIAAVAAAAENARNASGKDAAATVAEFAKIADDPVKGVQELNRQYNFLTGATLAQITALQQQGRTQEAVTLGINAYASAINSRAPAIKENLGSIERAWKGIKDLSREAGDALLSIGRDKSPVQSLEQQIAGLQRLAASGGRKGLFGEVIETPEEIRAQAAPLYAELEGIRSKLRKDQSAAAADAARQRAVQAQGELAGEAQQYETAADRRARQVAALEARTSKAIADARIAGDAAAEREVAAARDRVTAGISRESARSQAAVASVDAGLVRDTTDRALTELDRLYDRGEIKLAEFLRRKAALQVRAIDAELAAARAARAAAAEPEDIARANADITKLQRQRAQVARDIEAERATLAQQAADEVTQIRAQQLEAEGRLEEAAMLRFEQQYRALRKRLAAEGDTGSLGMIDSLQSAARAAIRQQTTDQVTQLRAQQLENEGKLEEAAMLRLETQYRDLRKRLANDPDSLAIIDNLINTERSRAKFAELQAQFETIAQGLQARQQAIADQVATGQLTPAAADEQQRAARADALAQMEALNAKVRELAASTNDPAIIQGAAQISAALRGMAVDSATGIDAAIMSLRTGLANLQQSFAQSVASNGVDALSSLFTDLASGSKSAGDSIRDFARSFLASMAQIAARALATYLVLQLLDAAFPGAGKAAAAAMSVGVKHSGGMVGAAGVTRSVDPGLFAAAPRYHSGGMVGLKPGEVPIIAQEGERVLNRQETAAYNQGGQRGGGYRIVNVVDPALVSGYLESSAGEETIINAIGRNPGRVRQLIGG